MAQPIPVNPVGVHTSIWDPRWDVDGAEQVLSRARAAGFDFVEILLVAPESIDVEATRDRLAHHGLTAIGAFGLSTDADVSSEAMESVREGERQLHAALVVGVELGITHFTGVLYGSLACHAAPVTAAGLSNSVGVIRGLCDEAQRAGVRVALEVLNRYESNVINTAEQALRYIDRVGSTNLYVELDTYHMNIEEFGAYDAVSRCGDRLGYVQVGESHRGYLGHGNVRFDEVFRALAMVGYDGPIGFESFSSASGDPELHGLLSIWRDVWTDADNLALHARSFIDSGLRAVRPE